MRIASLTETSQSLASTERSCENNLLPVLLIVVASGPSVPHRVIFRQSDSTRRQPKPIKTRPIQYQSSPYNLAVQPNYPTCAALDPMGPLSHFILPKRFQYVKALIIFMLYIRYRVVCKVLGEAPGSKHEIALVNLVPKCLTGSFFEATCRKWIKVLGSS
jgi:hypothetical protein